jgi:hypothetical protein
MDKRMYDAAGLAGPSQSTDCPEAPDHAVAHIRAMSRSSVSC